MKPIRFYLLALVIVLSDQVSKWSVVRTLRVQGERPLLGTFLQLHYTRNTGGAFSLFQASNSVFVAVAIAAGIALIVAYHRMRDRNLQVTTALSLALGGAVGNLIDRVRFGYVIDFFDFHGWSNHTLWPIFNVADSAISIAIVLLAWHFLLAKPGQAASGDVAPETSPTAPV